MFLRTRDLALLNICHEKSVQLLRANAVRGGVLAATANAIAFKRGYSAIYKLARVCALRNGRFTEWLHGKTLVPRGMPGQSWNAAAFLMAEHAVVHGKSPFALPSLRRMSGV